jgi:peptidoglycan/LPS O-acetylase OafA/YrhL
VVVPSRDFWRFERDSAALAALDGLRAIAVLLVVWRHGVFPYFEAHGGKPILDLFGYDLATLAVNGWIGVDLFFVLSGFLIARLLLGQQDKPGGLRFGPYIFRRAMRIFPTYVFVIALVVAGAIPFFAVTPEALNLRVAYHLLMLQDYLPPNIVVAFWSLGVEEKFYLAAPLILGTMFAVRSFRLRLTLVLAAVAAAILLRIWAAATLDSAPGTPMSYGDFLPVFRYPFHACLDTLGLGMAAALLHRRAMADPQSWLRRQATPLFWAGTLWLLVLAAPGVLLARIDWWDQTLQPTAIGLGFTAILLGAALGGGPQRFLGAPALLVVARISYPLYLVHMAVIPLSWALVGGSPAGDGAMLLRFLPVYGACALALALAVHFGVEKPFLILRDKLDQGFWRRPAPLAPKL